MRGRRRERASRLLVKHTPTIFITDTFQVGLAVAMIGMGLATIYAATVGDSGAIARTLPILALRLMWSACFLIGGFAQLAGLHVPSRKLERLGLNLCGLGCTVYAGTLFSQTSTVSSVLGLVFAVLAFVYFVRVVISNLARSSGTT